MTPIWHLYPCISAYPFVRCARNAISRKLGNLVFIVIAWIFNRDSACQRKNEFFFFFESIKTNTWCEFRAAIFVGTASENQLNGNNESLCMSSEVHTCCNRATRSCVRDDPARIFKSVYTKLMSSSCEFLSMIFEQNCFEELHEIG